MPAAHCMIPRVEQVPSTNHACLERNSGQDEHDAALTASQHARSRQARLCVVGATLNLAQFTSPQILQLRAIVLAIRSVRPTAAELPTGCEVRPAPP